MKANYYTKQYWQDKAEQFSAKVNEPFTHGSLKLRLNHARYVLENGYIDFQTYMSKTRQQLKHVEHVALA